MVQNRYFFHASGFDQYDSAAQYRRFVREAARFATTWNVTADVSALHNIDAGDGRWDVTTRAPGWQVHTRYELLDGRRDGLKELVEDLLIAAGRHGGIVLLGKRVGRRAGETRSPF